MKLTITEEVPIPEGVTASYQDGTFSVEGKAGKASRKLNQPGVTVSVANNTVSLTAENATQREKRHIYTIRSHIRNLLRGAAEGHTYKLKVCSGHFPMNVSVSGDKLTVKNFLGEAVPRVLVLKQGATVKLDGDIITVTAPSKETAGQQAADIEQLTRITNRDRRIFQDGLYIIEKDGRPLL